MENIQIPASKNVNMLKYMFVELMNESLGYDTEKNVFNFLLV